MYPDGALPPQASDIPREVAVGQGRDGGARKWLRAPVPSAAGLAGPAATSRTSILERAASNPPGSDAARPAEGPSSTAAGLCIPAATLHEAGPGVLGAGAGDAGGIPRPASSSLTDAQVRRLCDGGTVSYGS
jgi:hypothetical protein